MRRLLLLSLVASGTLGASTLVLPQAAGAQQADRVVDIYGNDRCPASQGQQIVVCHRHPETERYRIPKELREEEPAPQAAGGNTGAVSAVNNTGQTGVQVNSCNAIGAGVNAGCLKKQADAWKADQKAQKKAEAGIP